MKNIHLLPTKNGLPVQSILPHVKNYEELNYIHQNIYITSDEEIKKGYYGLGFPLNVNGEKRKLYVFKEHLHSFERILILCDERKKIILTTDEDLIKDGVQAIDDEFLKWFVKNPSCEEVDIEKSNLLNTSRTYLGVDKYKIIIPKEEPKQEPCDNCNNDVCCCNIKKQETLEEAAERFVEAKQFRTEKKDKTRLYSFIEGAKWQQKRSYSEKEVWKLLCQFDMSKGRDLPTKEFNEWFEQFKKK